MANQLSGKIERKILAIVISVLAFIFIAVAIVIQIRQSSQYENELIDKAKRISFELQNTWDQAADVVNKDDIQISDSTIDLISLIHFLPKGEKKDSLLMGMQSSEIQLADVF